VPLESGGIGWSYVDGEFVPPVAPIEEAPEPTVTEALVTATTTEALAPSIEE
jgi:hypothetical protein